MCLVIATEVLTLFLDAETYNLLVVLFFIAIKKLVEDGCHGKPIFIASHDKVVPKPVVRNFEEYSSKKFGIRLNPDAFVQSVL